MVISQWHGCILCAHIVCVHMCLAPKFFENVLSNLPKDITTVCNDELQELKKEDPRYSGKFIQSYSSSCKQSHPVQACVSNLVLKVHLCHYLTLC